MASKTPKSTNNGIANPSGLLMGNITFVYAAAVPLVSWLTAPGAMVQSVAQSVLRIAIPGTLANRQIPALAALYIFAVWPLTGSLSVAGQASSRNSTFDNKHPRRHVSQLAGLPLRLYSAHNNLLETFPAFAAAAALAQILAPNNQQIVNLLSLHVLAKLFVFYPAYVLNVDPVRSTSHLVAISSIFAVCWKIARGA